MVLVNLMIQVVSGVIGGNAASGALRNSAPRTGIHSLLGALGSVCCAQLLGLDGLGRGSLDLASMATHSAVGMLGGGALVALAGVIRAMRRSGR